MIKASLADRFWGKVEKTETCWLWKGTTRGHMRYGAISFKCKMLAVHRLSYEMHIGPIPPGLLVMHTCDVPRCVNPNHLKIGTNQDNIDDKMNKNRHHRTGPRGEKSGIAKLTNSAVNTIRLLWQKGEHTQQQIADIFKVNQSQISRVIRKLTWKY